MAFCTGEGVYERSGRTTADPFLLERHFDRLRASAAAIGCDSARATVSFADATRHGAGGGRAGRRRMLHRLLVTRGVGPELRPASLRRDRTVISSSSPRGDARRDPVRADRIS